MHIKAKTFMPEQKSKAVKPVERICIIIKMNWNTYEKQKIEIESQIGYSRY